MRKAFSLVELLIVVTIISVLTGAALPFVSEYLEDARNAKAKNDLDELARAITAFETVNGTDYSDTSGNALIGRYIQRIPIDPWGVPYSFASANESNGATVYSHGPDHLPGTNDDIVQSYKGKLAIVSAKWFDVNGDGRISSSTQAFPSTDTLTIRFNRAASTTNLTSTTVFTITSAGSKDFAHFFTNTAATTASGTAVDNKTWVYEFWNSPDVSTGEFALGSDTIEVTNSTDIPDLNGTPMVKSPVILLAK